MDDLRERMESDLAMNGRGLSGRYHGWPMDIRSGWTLSWLANIEQPTKPPGKLGTHLHLQVGQAGY